MQMYLADHCIDGLGSASRWKTSLTVMIGTPLLLPILSFSVLLVPLAPPEKGFHANWVFNYLVHPVLNYVVCRAELEVGIRRPLAVWDRQRVCWIVQWVPLVGCLVARCKNNLRDLRCILGGVLQFWPRVSFSWVKKSPERGKERGSNMERFILYFKRTDNAKRGIYNII